MGNKYEQFKKSCLDRAKKTLDYDDLSEKTFGGVAMQYAAEKNKSSYRAYIHNIFNDLLDRDNKLTQADKTQKRQKFINFVEQKFEKRTPEILERLLSSKENKRKLSKAKKQLSAEDYLNYCKTQILVHGAFNDKNVNNIVSDYLKTFDADDKSLYNPKKVEDLFKETEDLFGIQEEAVPNPLTYLEFAELSEESKREYPFKDTINELVNDSKDEEYTKILKDCNNILSVANSYYKNQVSSLAENTGQACDESYAKMMQQELNIRNYDKNKVSINSQDIEINNNDFNEDIKIANDVLKHDQPFEKEIGKKIAKLIKEMNEADIVVAQASMEEQFKRYSMQKLLATKEQLENAVKSKNKEDIVKYHNEYQKQERYYDSFVKQSKEIFNSDLFPGNISTSRNIDAPSKYMEDFKGTSQTTCIWGLANFFKLTGYKDYEKFFEAPLTNFHKISISLFKNPPILEEIKKFSPKDILNTVGGFESKKYMSTVVGAIGDLSGLYRIEQGISALGHPNDPKKQRETIVDFSLYYATTQNKAIDEINEATFAFTGPEKQKNIRNFLLVEPEDRDVRKIFLSKKGGIDLETLKEREPFNAGEYAKTKTNPTNVLNRYLEVADASYAERNNPEEGKQYLNYASNLLKNAAECKGLFDEKQISEFDKKLFAKMEAGKINKITQHDREMLKIEQLMNQINKDELNKENLIPLLDNLARVQNRLDNRGFFNKWYNSKAVENEELMIQNMRDILLDHNISNEVIDNYVKGVKENNEAAKTEAINDMHHYGIFYDSIVNPQPKENKVSLDLGKDELNSNPPQNEIVNENEKQLELNNENLNVEQKEHEEISLNNN